VTSIPAEGRHASYLSATFYTIERKNFIANHTLEVRQKVAGQKAETSEKWLQATLPAQQTLWLGSYFSSKIFNRPDDALIGTSECRGKYSMLWSDPVPPDETKFNNHFQGQMSFKMIPKRFLKAGGIARQPG
jgi:hypothetical protein